MSGAMAGSGIPLQSPQNLYPTELANVSYDMGNNLLTLPPGGALALPRGAFLVETGPYSFLQFNDPVTGIWRGHNAFGPRGVQVVHSDGTNVRVANLLGCPVGGVVTNAGSAYVQATTIITPSVGNSVWQPIVGGKLTAVSSITAAGAGFTVQPFVFIPDPPFPGVPATAYATLSSGTVGGVTILNSGGGYTGTALTGLLLPDPTDPNINSITPGTVVFTVGGSGSLVAALCTNPGQPIAAASINTMSLSITGAGSAAAVSPVLPQTVTTVAISGGGTGYGNALNSKLTSAGGRNTASDAVTNPAMSFTGFLPRAVDGYLTSNAGGTLTASTVYDSGLFTAAPTPIVIPASGLALSGATVTFTMGTVNDNVLIQPLRN